MTTTTTKKEIKTTAKKEIKTTDKTVATVTVATVESLANSLLAGTDKLALAGLSTDKPSFAGLSKIQTLEFELALLKAEEQAKLASLLALVKELASLRLAHTESYKNFLLEQIKLEGLSLKEIKRSTNSRPNGVINAVGVALGDTDDTSAGGMHWRIIRQCLTSFAEGGYKAATFNSSQLEKVDLSQADPQEVRSAKNAFCDFLTSRYGVRVNKGRFQAFDTTNLSSVKKDRLEEFLKSINWNFLLFPIE